MSLGAEPPPEPAGKDSLTLRAKLIEFDRAKGTVFLQGQVHVTRVDKGQSMTVECEEMTATIKDGKMETVDAKRDVRLTSPESAGTAASATLDFQKNIITLRGDKDRPASVTHGDMVSTGPTIIFYLDDQRVKMPDGGTTVVNLNPPSKKKPDKEKP